VFETLELPAFSGPAAPAKLDRITCPHNDLTKIQPPFIPMDSRKLDIVLLALEMLTALATLNQHPHE
jgi:hypothetical protein